MASDAPLFCPFCRECYDEEETCPVHELSLVPFEQLPKPPRRLPRLDAVLPVHDHRFGRLPVFVGALLTVVGFVLPMVRIVGHGQEEAYSGALVAASRAPNLWMVPGVAAGLLFVLWRRRSRIALSSARLAVPLLVVLAVASITYTLYRIALAAGFGSSHAGSVSVVVAPGVWVMLAGLVVALVGSLRLGGVTKAERQALKAPAVPRGDGAGGVDPVPTHQPALPDYEDDEDDDERQLH